MSAEIEKMQGLLKKSLITIKKLEQELTGYKAKESEKISIVGFACRFPKGINSLEKLNVFLKNKENAVEEIPFDRFDVNALYSEDNLAEGKMSVKHGTFISEDVTLFDAPFFGITPREAKSIDPVHRMILELTQEALDDAGIPSDKIKGGNVSVYAAIGNSDYMQARLHSGNLSDVDMYDTTGVAYASASGRVSYLFDFQGPSYTIDATCTSALAAVHQACKDLKEGISDIAIVSAGNLLLTPEVFVGLSKLGSLSKDGVCRAFDNNANGFVRGEGGATLVLKRTTDAIKDKNQIYAHIVASKIRHNGASNGFTAPNPVVQEKLIEETLQAAKLTSNDIDFVEIHGIGNTFTDALEANAVGKAYRDRDKPLYIGTIKPNIGHLEAAIGMAMLAKVVCSLQSKTILPNINITNLNQDIQFGKYPIQVPTDNIPWEKDGIRRAAINLSGFTGTNLHMILEEAPSLENPNQEKRPLPNYLFSISAKTEDGLKQLAQNYLENIPNDLGDACHTLLAGRNIYDEKLILLAKDASHLKSQLSAFAEGENSKELNNIKNKDVAFLFTGQGSQYHNMCYDLYTTNQVFKNSVNQCDEILNKYLEIPIVDVLYNKEIDTALINQSQYTQVALFTVEYALAKMWISWGVQPSALLGHSVGEYVAATIAGVFSLEDALWLVSERGRLIQSLPTDAGTMAAVLCNREIIAPYLDKYNEKVETAAINSSKSITISGDKESVLALVAELKENKIKAIPLTVSHAFHSYLLEPILEDFKKAFDNVEINSPRIPILSNVSGKEIEASELTPQYFSNHIRATVLFKDNVNYLKDKMGINIFLEAGPSSTLLGLAKQTLEESETIFLASAKNNNSSYGVIQESLKQLLELDFDINWKAFYADLDYRFTHLPAYPWQKQKYWYSPLKSISSTQNIKDIKEPEEIISTDKVSKDNLMSLMQREASAILGLEKGKFLDPIKGLREQGYDSLMAAEFFKKMERHLGKELDMSVMLVYGSLQTLHDYFVHDIIGENEFVSVGDVMFYSNDDNTVFEDDGDWHEIKKQDAWWLKTFKKIDKYVSVKSDE